MGTSERLLIAVVVALLGLATTTAHADERLADRIAIVVNDDVIVLSELYDFAGDEIEAECLPPAVTPCVRQMLGEAGDILVRRALQRQELQRLGEDVKPEDIDRTIQTLVRENGIPDREALRNEVEQSGVSWDVYLRFQIEDYVREQKFNGIVLRSRVSISEDELKDQYQRLIREIGSAEVVRLDAFGFPLPPDPEFQEQKLAEIRSAIVAVREGRARWEDVVAKYDLAGMGPMLRDHPFKVEELVPEMRGAVEGLPTGAVADPVVFNGMVLGLRVAAREQVQVEVPPFEEVKDRLADQVFQRRLEQAGDEWFEGARRRAAIRWLIDVGRTSTTTATSVSSTTDTSAPDAPSTSP